jgi:hypothetical protein
MSPRAANSDHWPADLDAERFVLAWLLQNPLQYPEIVKKLAISDFSLNLHQRIFGRMGDLYIRDQPIDTVTLAKELQSHNELGPDGITYLTNLDTGMPQLLDVERYLKRLREYGDLRELMRLSECAFKRAAHANGNAPQVLVQARETFSQFFDRRLKFPSIGDAPVALSVTDLLNLQGKERKMLVESLLPTPGAVVLMGSHKSGKTVLAVQMAVAVASGHALMNNYRVMDAGPVIVVEQDDSAGDVSMRDYLRASPVPVAEIPLRLFIRVSYNFGANFCAWLERQIMEQYARMVVLDSYTALRPHRKSGGDIVKTEADELAMLDQLAKQHNCLILILHHVSKGSSGLDWSNQGAGTYAIGAGVEGQIHIERFRELAGNAPERLVQVRGRHMEGVEAVICFRKATLDYDLIFEGPTASLFVDIQHIAREFGDAPFTQKQLYQELGMSRTTAYRLCTRLLSAGALLRQGYGEYRIVPEVVRAISGQKLSAQSGTSG